MKTRTIIATFVIEDNDLVEQNLFKSLQCESFKDFKKLPDTKELYENNSEFRSLVKAKKEAQRVIDDFINKHNFKK